MTIMADENEELAQFRAEEKSAGVARFVALPEHVQADLGFLHEKVLQSATPGDDDLVNRFGHLWAAAALLLVDFGLIESVSGLLSITDAGAEE